MITVHIYQDDFRHHLLRLALRLHMLEIELRVAALLRKMEAARAKP